MSGAGCYLMIFYLEIGWLEFKLIITRMIWIRESSCLRGGSRYGCALRAVCVPY